MQALSMDNSDAFKAQLVQDYGMGLDASEGLKVAALTGFVVNLVCLLVNLFMLIFVMTGSVKRLFQAQSWMNKVGCCLCVAQIAAIIVIPIYVFSGEASFCSGNSFFDPTTGVQTTVMWGQLVEQRERLRKTWVSELVLFFTFFFLLCCVTMCCFGAMVAKGMEGMGREAQMAAMR